MLMEENIMGETLGGAGSYERIERETGEISWDLGWSWKVCGINLGVWIKLNLLDVGKISE